jgi:D-arabinose 1-dehydrogenase-like Zn-dependent alcohol dehydrogenase
MTMSSPVLGRVAEVTGPRTFTVGERWFDPPPAGRVLVKIDRVGICASDLDDWRTGPADGAAPLLLGHEPVGVVHAVGAGVEGLRVGEVVTGRLVPCSTALATGATEAFAPGDPAPGPADLVVEALTL